MVVRKKKKHSPATVSRSIYCPHLLPPEVGSCGEILLAHMLLHILTLHANVCKEITWALFSLCDEL